MTSNSKQIVDSLTDLTACITSNETELQPSCLEFISKNPLAASSSYTVEDLSLLMLAVKYSQTSSAFVQKLIELLTEKQNLPLKLAKKSVVSSNKEWF